MLSAFNIAEQGKTMLLLLFCLVVLAVVFVIVVAVVVAGAMCGTQRGHIWGRDWVLSYWTTRRDNWPKESEPIRQREAPFPSLSWCRELPIIYWISV